MTLASRAAAVVMMCVVGFTMSACSGQYWDASPNTDESATDQLQPSWPAGVDPDSATVGVVLDDVRNDRSMPWTLTAISPDRRQISVYYVIGDGSCLVHSGYHLSVNGNTVTLGEYSHTTPGSDACPAMLKLGLDTIDLPVALDGTTDLIHAPTAQSTPESW